MEECSGRADRLSTETDPMLGRARSGSEGSDRVDAQAIRRVDPSFDGEYYGYSVVYQGRSVSTSGGKRSVTALRQDTPGHRWQLRPAFPLSPTQRLPVTISAAPRMRILRLSLTDGRHHPSLGRYNFCRCGICVYNGCPNALVPAGCESMAFRIPIGSSIASAISRVQEYETDGQGRGDCPFDLRGATQFPNPPF